MGVYTVVFFGHFLRFSLRGVGFCSFGFGQRFFI